MVGCGSMITGIRSCNSAIFALAFVVMIVLIDRSMSGFAGAIEPAISAMIVLLVMVAAIGELVSSKSD